MPAELAPVGAGQRRTGLGAALLALVLLAAYLCLWPVPVEPRAWTAPPPPGYAGVFAENRILLRQRAVPLKGSKGPEHVLAGPHGWLYTGLADGRILRMRPDGSAQEVIATTGGRPLGMAFDAHGRLVVADARMGLLRIAPDGAVTLLSDAVAGSPIGFANAVAVAPGGQVYFTDSSTRFVPARHGGSTETAALLDVLEQSASGRVLAYDPATGATRIVAQGLSLANGIALAPDGRSLYVAESGRYRVWKIALAAAELDVRTPSPQARVLLDNLPGYPDNLTTGREGRIWLGIAGRRDGLDALSGYPLLRAMVLRIPRVLWRMPPAHGHVLAFTEAQGVVASLQDASGASPNLTGATETAEGLYLHSVGGAALGWLPRGSW